MGRNNVDFVDEVIINRPEVDDLIEQDTSPIQNLRALINSQISDCIHTQMTKDDIMKEISDRFGNRDIVCFSYGQKHREEDGFEIYATLSQVFQVDLALAMEISKPDYFFTANSQQAAAMKHVYPFMLSLKACNMLIPSSSYFVEDSYRLIVYNNCHHIKKHASYRIKLRGEQFIPAFTETFRSVAGFVQRHVVEKIRTDSALRIETYFSYSDNSIEVMKGRLHSYLRGHCLPLKASTQMVVDKINEMIQALFAALSFFHVENYSSWYSLLELYRQFTVAVFCSEKMSHNFKDDHLGFKLDTGLYQVMSNLLTSTAMAILLPEKMNKYMSLFSKVDCHVVFCFMLYYKEVRVTPAGVANVYGVGSSILGEFAAEYLTKNNIVNIESVEYQSNLIQFLESFHSFCRKPLVKRIVGLIGEISSCNELLYSQIANTLMNYDLCYRDTNRNVLVRINRETVWESYTQFTHCISCASFTEALRLYVDFLSGRLNKNHPHYNFIVTCQDVNAAALKKAKLYAAGFPNLATVARSGNVLSISSNNVGIARSGVASTLNMQTTAATPITVCIQSLDADMFFRCLYATLPNNELCTHRVYLPQMFNGFEDFQLFLCYATVMSNYYGDVHYRTVSFNQSPKLENLRERVTSKLTDFYRSLKYKAAILLLSTGAFLANQNYNGAMMKVTDLSAVNFTSSHISFTALLDIHARLHLISQQALNTLPSTLIPINITGTMGLDLEQFPTPVSSVGSSVLSHGNIDRALEFNRNRDSNNYENVENNTITNSSSHGSLHVTTPILEEFLQMDEELGEYSRILGELPDSSDSLGNEEETARNYADHFGKRPKIMEKNISDDDSLSEFVQENQIKPIIVLHGLNSSSDESTSIQQSSAAANRNVEQDSLVGDDMSRGTDDVVNETSNNYVEENISREAVVDNTASVRHTIVNPQLVDRLLTPLTQTARSPYKIAANPTVVTETEFWQLLEQHSVARNHVPTFRGSGIDIACLIEFDSTSLVQYLENDLSLNRIVAASIHNIFKQYRIL